MKIINQSHEIKKIISDNLINFIVKYARTSYKSEN